MTRPAAEEVHGDRPRCVRCGRLPGWLHRWPEGVVCSTCRNDALEVQGRCASCGAQRMTPGIAAGGGRLCVDCAGIPGNFFCIRCGHEGLRQRDHVRRRCILTEMLRDVLDDGSGQISSTLRPLFDRLRQVERPLGCQTWLRQEHVQRMLRSLPRGRTPLTHEGLSTLGAPRTVAYLRDLLMKYGLLPARDRHLLMFESWLAGHLAAVDDAEQRKLLNQYATWDVLRKLRESAARGSLGPSRDSTARDRLRKATEFLMFLSGRSRTAAQCTQADLDAWHAEHRLARRHAQQFLRWCIRTGNMPRLTIPNISTRNPAPLDQHRRITLIRRAVTDEQIPVMDRVTAMLLLLYAQPITRIVQLTLDDISHHDGQVLLRLGDPPTPVPEPFAILLLGYAAARPNTKTATNPDGRWLFPGRRAGRPIHPSTIEKRLRDRGFAPGRARTSAIRHLVLQAPAPVVASMLGYNNESLTVIAAQAAGPWRRYAPGDHRR